MEGSCLQMKDKYRLEIINNTPTTCLCVVNGEMYHKETVVDITRCDNH